MTSFYRLQVTHSQIYRLTGSTGLQTERLYRLIGFTGLPIFTGYKLQTHKHTGSTGLQIYRFYRLTNFYKLQVTNLQTYRFTGSAGLQTYKFQRLIVKTSSPQLASSRMHVAHQCHSFSHQYLQQRASSSPAPRNLNRMLNLRRNLPRPCAASPHIHRRSCFHTRARARLKPDRLLLVCTRSPP